VTGTSRIIGIDPGSRTTGYGIIDSRGSQIGFVARGIIRTAGNDRMGDRLQAIYEGLRDIIGLHGPEVAAVEDVFISRNPRAALKLGQARGAAVLAAVRCGLPVHDYEPRLVKQAVAGYGQADKQQVQHMVRALLELTCPPSDDAADALAVAICHANHLVLLPTVGS
jgi:crossover junction endodeoxyribonuclease RuvC